MPFSYADYSGTKASVRSLCANSDEEEIPDSLFADGMIHYDWCTRKINNRYPTYDTMDADDKTGVQIAAVYLLAARFCANHCKGNFKSATDDQHSYTHDKIDWDALAKKLYREASSALGTGLLQTKELYLIGSGYDPTTGDRDPIIASASSGVRIDMIKALRGVRKFTPSVVVNRYDAMGVVSVLSSRAMFKKFSSDAKRKTAAYDRIGFTLPNEALLAGEEPLTGDLVIYGTDKYIVGKLVSNQYWVPRGPFEGCLTFEALYCNARVNVRNSSVVEDPVDGQATDPDDDPPVFSNIPVSISSAEYYTTEPLAEVKDKFFLGVPGTLSLAVNQVIEILAFSDTDGMLDHTSYRIEHPIVDSVGVKKYVINKNLDGFLIMADFTSNSTVYLAKVQVDISDFMRGLLSNVVSTSILERYAVTFASAPGSGNWIWSINVDTGGLDAYLRRIRNAIRNVLYKTATRKVIMAQESLLAMFDVSGENDFVFPDTGIKIGALSPHYLGFKAFYGEHRFGRYSGESLAALEASPIDLVNADDKIEVNWHIKVEDLPNPGLYLFNQGVIPQREGEFPQPARRADVHLARYLEHITLGPWNALASREYDSFEDFIAALENF